MENSGQMKEKPAASQAKDHMLSGSAWRTGADMIGKVLGVVYIIPWFAWMGHFGNQANALYSMGYNIYALFLLISTVGIPSAVAREVARYNTLEDPNMAYRLVRQILGVMMLLGIVAAAIMFFFAPFLSELAGGGTDLIPVMKSLALAILIFPSMSVIRGYFQGINQMKAYAMSQLLEQIVRIIWMLATTFAIMKLGSHDWQAAVTQSTTAAFIGMLGSYAVLVFYLYRSGNLQHLIKPGPAKHEVHALDIMKTTMHTAIPFIVIGSAIQVFKLIDQSSFMHVMHWTTSYSDDQLMAFISFFSANTDKLTMLLLGVALTLGSVSDPLITEHYVKGNRRELSILVGYNFQLYFGFMLPAVVGMALLTKPIYTIFYEVPTTLQSSLFVFAILQSLLLGLYMLVYPPLTVMDHKRVAMRFFVMTLIVKVVLQVPFILLFHSFGPLIATTITFLFGISLYMRKLHQITHFSIKNTIRGVQGSALLTFVMAIVVVIIELILGLIFGKTPGRIGSALIAVIAGGAGFYVYLWLSAQLGLLEKWFGARGKALRRKLRI
jgi:O-antigen/teichoic acid export membrane protein